MRQAKKLASPMFHLI